MTSTIQISKKGTLDDLLFRGKNKAYGAYPLRKYYDRRLRSALFYFVMSIAGIALFSAGYLQVKEMLGLDINSEEPPVFDDETILIEYIPTVVLPKVTPKVLQQDIKSTKLVPPVIVDEVLEKTTEKTTQDIIKDDGLIAAVDNDGPETAKPSIDPIQVGKSSGNIVNTVPVSDAPLDIVEVLPEFPGGEDALMRYLKEKTKVPDFAGDIGVESGIVVIGFVVNEVGEVVNVKIEKGAHKLLNKLALNTVRQMPLWLPGQQAGHKVKVNMAIPFNFDLD